MLYLKEFIKIIRLLLAFMSINQFSAWSTRVPKNPDGLGFGL